MRFCKVALIVVGSTILLSGCAQRQYRRGHQPQRTYYRSAPQQLTPIQNPGPSQPEYHADPPAQHPREQSGPSQPVPAPPASEVSLKKVQGVSFTSAASRVFRGRSCAAEPLHLGAEREGCQKSYAPKRKSYFSKSADFFKRFCPKKTTACVVEAPCGDLTTVTEGCAKRKSYFPKYKAGMVSGFFEKCIGKKFCKSKDLCVPNDGCGAYGTLQAQVDYSYDAQPQPVQSHSVSPRVNRLEDPFEQPATAPARPAVPAVPVAPRPVPEVPQNDEPAPAAPDMPGRAQPVENVPPLPDAQKGLDPIPMPEAGQAYVEPQSWPKLRIPAGRLANVPTTQTSWGSTQPSWQYGLYGTSTPNQPVRSNGSPWSTSWQIR